MAAPADADEVRKILQAAVHNCGGTQKDLARHLGFSEKHVSQVMTGRAGITLPVLFQILDYVGVTLLLAEPE